METNESKAFIMEKLVAQGDYAFLPEGLLEEMVDELQALDQRFMAETGVDNGEAYDDDAAVEALHKGMRAAYAAYAMYMLRLTEDYLDYNEEYLESIGAIEWH